jgi:hypothetical protein
MSDTVQLALVVQSLAARQQVLSITVHELLRLLPGHEASACAHAVSERVGELVSGSTATCVPQIDEAVAQELAAVLAALRT